MRSPFTRPKTAEEIKNTMRAVDIIAGIFRDIEPFGRREGDVAREIRRRIRAQGARPSFPPIVASGRNTGFVHHRPGRKIVRDDEPVIFDIGARFMGQCSDITRMHVPGGWEHAGAYRRLMEIQEKCISMARPGRTMAEMHKAFSGMMKRSRFRVKHGIGHAIGQRVHERVEGGLRPGVVITIEPGIYEINGWGCRMEDMLLITEKGHRVLSRLIPPGVQPRLR